MVVPNGQRWNQRPGKRELVRAAYIEKSLGWGGLSQINPECRIAE